MGVLMLLSTAHRAPASGALHGTPIPGVPIENQHRYNWRKCQAEGAENLMNKKDAEREQQEWHDETRAEEQQQIEDDSAVAWRLYQQQQGRGHQRPQQRGPSRYAEPKNDANK